MTLDGWISKACKTGPFVHHKFLESTREFLLTGDHSVIAAPILAQYERREIFATPAVTQLVTTLLQWKSDQALAKHDKRNERHAANRNWRVKIVSPCHKMVNAQIVTSETVHEAPFEQYNAAYGWACRRLETAADGSKALIIADKAQEKTVVVVDRNEALYYLNPKPRAAACKLTVKLSSTGLRMGMKQASNPKFYFSRG